MSKDNRNSQRDAEPELPTLELDMRDVVVEHKKSEAKKAEEKTAQEKPAGVKSKAPKLPQSRPAHLSAPGSVHSPIGVVAVELEAPPALARSFSGDDLRPRRDFEIKQRPSLPFRKVFVFLVFAGLIFSVYWKIQTGSVGSVGDLFNNHDIQLIQELRATPDMPTGVFQLNIGPKADRKTIVRVGEQVLENRSSIRFRMLFNKESNLTVNRDGFQAFSQRIFYTGYPAGSSADIPIDFDMVPDRFGTVVLTSTVPTKVTIEGQAGVWAKTSPVYGLKLPPGSYKVRFARIDSGDEKSEDLNVREDALAQVSENFPDPSPSKAQ
jgi:hypothetical protein